MGQTSIDLLKNKNSSSQNSLMSRLKIGAHQLNISYGNQYLKDLFVKAFKHIEIPASEGGDLFTIFVTDNNSKTSYKLRSEKFAIRSAETKMITYNKENWHMTFNPVSQVLSFVDTDNGVALYDIGNIACVPYFEIAAPMRYILHWFCEKHEKTLIHAAAIGTESKSVLITGPGGSGKSSTALTCALRGMDYVGDDYVVVERIDEPQVLSIYNSVKYRWDTITRMPELKQLAKKYDRTEEKGYFFFSDFSDSNIRTNMPLLGVILPVIGQEKRTTFIPEQSQKILLNLAASTIFQMPGSGNSTLKNIISILENLPFYRMSLGTEPEEIYSSIREFIENKI